MQSQKDKADVDAYNSKQDNGYWQIDFILTDPDYSSTIKLVGNIRITAIKDLDEVNDKVSAAYEIYDNDGNLVGRSSNAISYNEFKTDIAGKMRPASGKSMFVDHMPKGGFYSLHNKINREVPSWIDQLLNKLELSAVTYY